MAKSDDIARLPLPKCWPKFVRRALVLACSMLKAAFDIEVGRRLDCNLHHTEGFDPGPRRGVGSWDDFIRIHWQTLYACDFFTKEVWTLVGKVTDYVFFLIEVHTRRVHIAGMTTNPNGSWMAQVARNLCMWLEEEVCPHSTAGRSEPTLIPSGSMFGPPTGVKTVGREENLHGTAVQLVFCT